MHIHHTKKRKPHHLHRRHIFTASSTHLLPEPHTPLNHTRIVRISGKRRPRNLRNRNRAPRLRSTLHRRSLLLNHGHRRSRISAKHRHSPIVRTSLHPDGRHLDDVIRAERILRKTAVVLDELLDGVEIRDVDLERGLDGEESDALGARGGSQRTGVLEDVGGFDDGEDAAEVDAGLDGGVAARFADGV